MFSAGANADADSVDISNFDRCARAIRKRPDKRAAAVASVRFVKRETWIERIETSVGWDSHLGAYTRK